MSNYDNMNAVEAALATEYDAVQHPSHYVSHASGVECITIAEHFPYNIGNVIKYCWRAGLKTSDSVEDLRKAAWYIEREIARREHG